MVSDSAITSCPVKCPWCGAECKLEAGDKTVYGNPKHDWHCGSMQNAREPWQAESCEHHCELKDQREEFQGEIRTLKFNAEYANQFTKMQMREEIHAHLVSICDILNSPKDSNILPAYQRAASRLFQLAREYGPPEPEEGEA